MLRPLYVAGADGSQQGDGRDLLAAFREEMGIVNFQMLIEHHNTRDTLVLRLASAQDAALLARHTGAVIDALHNQRPMCRELVCGGKINPVRIEWVREQDLIINPRTGKLRAVIDQRREQGQTAGLSPVLPEL